MKSGDDRSANQARRILLLAFLNVAAAAVVAYLAYRTFGAVSGVDTNPPECYDSWGHVVSCSLTPPMLMLPTAGVVLLALAAWQTPRWRNRRG